MSVEAEQKALVRKRHEVETALAQHGELRHSTYEDTYFDSADGSLVGHDHELRVRVVRTADRASSILTVKGDVVDVGSGSKRETETEVSDAEAAKALLEQLGYRRYVEFTKECANVDLRAHGHDMLATLVTVPEIDGTFIELETIVGDEADLRAALDAVHATLGDLGIEEADFTSDTYTGAVFAARGRNDR